VIEEKQRLTQIDKERADRFTAEGLGAPKVLEGHDGSPWVFSHELRDYMASDTVAKHD